MDRFRTLGACAIACAFVAWTAWADEAAAPVPADAGADGVQRVTIVGGSYFFHPDQIAAHAGQPLEFSLRMEPGLIPHRFVLESADGRQLADVPLGTEAKTLRLQLPAGDYVFYCPNRVLHFKSHRERGMAGVLRVRE